MHEMGLCDALIKMIENIIADEDVTEVESVTLEIGELSGVIPRFMEECWEAVVARTPFEKTKLLMESIPGKLHCADCTHIFLADMNHLVCPSCQGIKLTPIGGTDMTLKEICAS